MQEGEKKKFCSTFQIVLCAERDVRPDNSNLGAPRRDQNFKKCSIANTPIKNDSLKPVRVKLLICKILAIGPGMILTLLGQEY